VLTHNYDKIFQELRTNSDIQITRSDTFKVNNSVSAHWFQLSMQIRIWIQLFTSVRIQILINLCRHKKFGFDMKNIFCVDTVPVPVITTLS
jgi:hypothetical protein